MFNSPGTPEFARISISGAVLISVATAGFFMFLVAKALRAQRAQPSTGAEGLVGQVGPVRKGFLPTSDAPGAYQGTVYVNGELWKALASEALERGEEVIVEKVSGFTLIVERSAK